MPSKTALLKALKKLGSDVQPPVANKSSNSGEVEVEETFNDDKTTKRLNEKSTADEELPMTFKELPIHDKTIKGLNEFNYLKLTHIQQLSIPKVLSGRDLLASATTGSGKTLSFLVPMLQRLSDETWGPYDGLGALVITPTRELALQIFNELRKVGKYHSFSAGLLIGGKSVDEEKDRVGKMNILICTPGRLLQHMDQSPSFDTTNLLSLILDEADMILDAGFQKTIDAIIEHLPKKRQTLLFSATMTSNVQDLARLSLVNPAKVQVGEDNTTPESLIQKYITTSLDMKLSILFSFIKTHLKKKILVFLSSCKQVRFVYETFCKLQPGVPLMHLHGKQKQLARINIFSQFNKKSQACLFATDIAARGLDFPAVDWVIQLDCPESVETYIHRVGRTARYNLSGQSLLLLDSSEAPMIEELTGKGIPIEEIRVNPAKTMSITSQLAGLVASSPELKYLAQKAFVTYMRSIHLQSNKKVFDVSKLPFEKYAESLGLPGAPQIKFLKKAHKNLSRQESKIDNTNIARLDTGNDDDEEVIKEIKPRKSKIERMFDKKNTNVLSSHFQSMIQEEDDADGSDDDILTLKRQDHDIDISIPITIKKRNKKEIVKRAAKGVRVVFDEEGNTHDPYALQSLDEFKQLDMEELKETHVQTGLAILQKADVEDKEIQKQKRKLIKDEKRFKEKAIRRLESGPAAQVTIGGINGEAVGEIDDVMTGSDYVSDGVMSGSDYVSDGEQYLTEDESRKRQKVDLESMDQSKLEEMALSFLN